VKVYVSHTCQVGTSGQGELQPRVGKGQHEHGSNDTRCIWETSLRSAPWLVHGKGCKSLQATYAASVKSHLWHSLVCFTSSVFMGC
jgi:hypothetical protein